ncbi:hypothetical protein ABZ851_14365 [Streptomyces sp. NPDC047049]|uniref:hypothetical protein n=1 Tax=Streptomyces sp. NPDC047049 TaxID=3156688 RepID=UPI0033E905F3
MAPLHLAAPVSRLALDLLTYAPYETAEVEQHASASHHKQNRKANSHRASP